MVSREANVGSGPGGMLKVGSVDMCEAYERRQSIMFLGIEPTQIGSRRQTASWSRYEVERNDASNLVVLRHSAIGFDPQYFERIHCLVVGRLASGLNLFAERHRFSWLGPGAGGLAAIDSDLPRSACAFWRLPHFQKGRGY